MDVKKFVTMSVALIIGIVLIAGVVTPVIASVSSDSGGNGGSSSGVETDISGYDRYAKATGSTDVTLYMRFDETGMYYSYSNPLSNPDAEKFYCTDFMLIGDVWYISGNYAYYGGVSYTWSGPVTISGTDVTLTLYDSIQGNHTVNLSNLMYYPNPEGKYVMPYKYDPSTDSYVDLPLYATNSAELVSRISVSRVGGNDALCDVFVIGTVTDYTTSVVQMNNAEFSAEWKGYSISDGLLTGGIMDFNGTYHDGSIHGTDLVVDEVGAEVPFLDEIAVGECNVSGYVMLMPVSVYSGGNGNSGMSSTLSTVLSVIPLVLTVGLVIGAISYLRFKD